MDADNQTTTSSSRDRRVRIALAVVLLVGLAARIGMACALGLSKAPEPSSDAREYDAYAWNLAQGNGYRGQSPDVTDQNHLTAYRPPGPSLLMAAIFFVVGHDYAAVRLVHCLLGTCSVLLLFLIGRRTFGDSVGLLAAAIYALYPVAVQQSTVLESEPLGVLLFLLFLEAALRFAERPTWLGAAWAGAALGAGLLTRANYVLMVPLFAVWALWQFRTNWLNLLRSAAVLVAAGAVLVPWTVRNYVVFHEVIPFSTMGGSALLQGNNSIVVSNPVYFGYSIWDTDIPEYRDALRSANDEVERDRRAKQFAVQWLMDNQDQWGFLVVHKFIRSWTPFLTNNPSVMQQRLYLATWGPLLLLFVPAFAATFYLGLRYRRPLLLLDLAILSYVINTILFFANIRYRAPVDPLCILLASLTMTWAFKYLRAGKYSMQRTPPPHPLETKNQSAAGKVVAS